MVYGWVVGRLNSEQRRKFDYALTPDEALVLDDPRLPPELQGVRPPIWSSGAVPYREPAPSPPQPAVQRPKAPVKRPVARARTRPVRRR